MALNFSFASKSRQIKFFNLVETEMTKYSALLNEKKHNKKASPLQTKYCTYKAKKIPGAKSAHKKTIDAWHVGAIALAQIWGPELWRLARRPQQFGTLAVALKVKQIWHVPSSGIIPIVTCQTHGQHICRISRPDIFLF